MIVVVERLNGLPPVSVDISNRFGDPLSDKTRQCLAVLRLVLGSGLNYKLQPGINPSDFGIPVIPHIDARILEAIEAGGILDMRIWHGCGATHCRAGWAVVLAGDEGRTLEEKFGVELAGNLIYAASRPGKPAPKFFADDEIAMHDIIACAKDDPLPEKV